MNKPISIIEALKGNVKPVKQLRYQFTCPNCGRDEGMSGHPSAVRCGGLGCWTMIEPEENPFFVEAE